MKIAIASGGQFHSIHLARQLMKKKILHRLYSWSCTLDERSFFKDKLVDNKFNQMIGWVYEKFRMQKIIPLSQWYVLHDNRFDQWLAAELQKEESLDLLVGWAHYILSSIPVAREKGARIVLEMGSMHILENQHILEQEFSKHGFHAAPIDQRNIDKMLQEYEEVDAIMVPSSHVFDSFVKHGFSSKKIIVIPYGTNIQQFNSRTVKPNKFHLLFVGRVGLAKGMHYLLEAWDKLNFAKKDAELHIVGPVDEQMKQYLERRKKNETVTWYGGVAHEKLSKLYRQASLFVLPSLQEGMAMVLIEAMASGLPIMATNRTGAEDLIVDGEQGFIINPSDSNMLEEKIAWGFEHPDELFDMGQKAAMKAKKQSWDLYGDSVVKKYKEILDQSYYVHESRKNIWKSV